MNRVWPSFVLVVCLSLPGLGCGEKNPGPDPKLLEELQGLKDERDRTKKQLDQCTKEFAEYKSLQTDVEQEVLVRIDGTTVEIVGKLKSTGGGGFELTEAEMAVLPSVQTQIRASKSAIQQCYNQALKTTAGLENRIINLAVTVKVNPDGKITSPSFRPEVSQAFSGCMGTVALKWKCSPYVGRAFPVQVNIELHPQQ
jgi:hypothetical protein